MRHAFLAAAATLTLAGCAASRPAPTPDPIAPAVSRAVTLGEGSQALHGTLLAPAAGPRAPAVLIIAGSGPTDRDGDNPLGVKARSYRLLAEGLAAHGIASLRYDKRGVAASAPAAAREEDLRIETYADDARAWARRLRLPDRSA